MESEFKKKMDKDLPFLGLGRLIEKEEEKRKKKSKKRLFLCYLVLFIIYLDFKFYNY